MVDFYDPQVMDQYGEAKDEATFRLARAGTLNSSAAADVTADLAKQNTLNRADVQAKADAGAADLRSRVASEQAKAESQLYATENPDVATNQALAAVKNIWLAEPELHAARRDLQGGGDRRRQRGLRLPQPEPDQPDPGSLQEENHQRGE